MCGIVGHIGPKNSVDVVIEGLRRLEYRGYDSAGVSFLDEKNQLHLIKKEGKLQNLIDALGDTQFTAESCIGHTRWATHGGVTDENSHPHMAGRISLVHNGIIENADVLRADLKEKGFQFLSETDSEVFLAIVCTAMDSGLSFFDAVTTSFKKIEGNSAFVILSADEQELIALKRSAPLVCGTLKSSQRAMVSSDAYALVGLVDKLYFPEDEVVCRVSHTSKEMVQFFELDGTPSSRFDIKDQEMSLDSTDKGNFEHFMLKEIYEQPALIRSLSQFYLNGEGLKAIEEMKALGPKKVHISACGTAAYAGSVIRDYIEGLARIPANVELASEFRYRNPIIGKEDLGLFISQSGETADTLAAQELCQENNVSTLAIVNVEGSTLFRECDKNLLIRAGVEIGVASTKAFTQQALTGRLMVAGLKGELADENLKSGLIKKYNLLAERIDQLLENCDYIKDIAENIYNYKGYFYTGRGQYYPISLEGALKLKEIAYVHAEGYAAGELKHGPIALIDENMVNIAIVGPELYDKTVSNIQEIKARKGKIVTIGPKGDKGLEKISDFYIPMDFEGLEELAPLYVNVANQLLAYYMAKFKGTDIDKPRNLAKSVTVE